MTILVVDASVAAKWLLPSAQEPLVDQANRLFARKLDGEISLIVPDLFWAEVGNILWKAVRQRRLTPDQSDESIAAAREWGFPTISSNPLLEAALRIARKHDRSFYDSIYLALAVSHHAAFITADERLANAVGTHLPVQWLGAM